MSRTETPRGRTSWLGSRTSALGSRLAARLHTEAPPLAGNWSLPMLNLSNRVFQGLGKVISLLLFAAVLVLPPGTQAAGNAVQAGNTRLAELRAVHRGFPEGAFLCTVCGLRAWWVADRQRTSPARHPPGCSRGSDALHGTRLVPSANAGARGRTVSTWTAGRDKCRDSVLSCRRRCDRRRERRSHRAQQQ